jgi:signal transduction histidine kinase
MGGGKTRNILVREEETEMGLSIIWEDDGVGVPFEQKQLIFTEGFGPNTGEGPFLAKEILSMTGLALSEGGEPGKGARYIVRAPSGSYTWRRTATS